MIGISILLAPAIGLVIGVILGMLGGGGSILTVPALVYLLSQDPHTAISSSLLIVGVTAFIGLVPHLKRNCVRVTEGVVFGLLGTAGTYFGTHFSQQINADVLLLLFAILIMFVAGMMFWRTFKSIKKINGQADDKNKISVRKFRSLRVVISATIVGVLTGFFGVGGGFIIVPALIFALDFTISAAIGTSLLVIAINSATALIPRVTSFLDMDWSLIGVFIVTAVIGSIVGGNIVGKISENLLNIAFASLLVIVSLFTAIQSFPSITNHI